MQWIKTHSFEETRNKINEIQRKTTDSILEDELKVNLIYFETINELSILNQKYIEHFKLDLSSYYEAEPLILAEDVLLKIDELVIDEKKRVKKKKRDDIVETTISLASTIIPVFPTINNISSHLSKVAKKARDINKNTSTTNNLTKVFNSKIAPLFTNKISNSNI